MSAVRIKKNLKEGKIVDKEEVAIHEMKDQYDRRKLYNREGYTVHAFDDADEDIRRDAYRALGYTEEAFDDKSWEIRIEAYRKRGFTEKAFDDKSWGIRREAYRVLGYTEKAFDDTFWEIRRDAYYSLSRFDLGMIDSLDFVRLGSKLFHMRLDHSTHLKTGNLEVYIRYCEDAKN